MCKPSANHVQIFAPRFAHPPLPGPTNHCNAGYKSLHSVTLTLQGLTDRHRSLTDCWLEGWARSHQLFHFTPNKLSSSQVHCEASFFLAWGRSLVVSHSNSWGLSFKLSWWCVQWLILFYMLYIINICVYFMVLISSWFRLPLCRKCGSWARLTGFNLWWRGGGFLWC